MIIEFLQKTFNTLIVLLNQLHHSLSRLSTLSMSAPAWSSKATIASVCFVYIPPHGRMEGVSEVHVCARLEEHSDYHREALSCREFKRRFFTYETLTSVPASISNFTTAGDPHRMHATKH